ncbi:MAG TPA: hypothetical protein VL994_06385 [Steroidobacteraceae bacterium]|nr:hypothetical protein [Steroidobacteraceae bacterium]
MGFLLLKIFFLLALAAGSGGALTYWWFRRHYEDVSLEYARSREEWQTWRHSFEERLAAQPAVDLEPVTAQLGALQTAISDIPTPEPVDLRPLQARLDELSQRIEAIRMPDLARTDQRLTAIEHALFPVQSRLDELTAAVRGRQPASDAAPALPEEPAERANLVTDTADATSDVEEREGGSNLLSHAAHGDPDDLTRIKGVAKVLEHKLHDVGVFYFWQIAEWTPDDVQHVESQLEGFHRRIEDDDWVGQAMELADQPSAAPRPKDH